MKNLSIIAASALLAGMASVATAQTTGYLYYAGGGVDAAGSATADDGTLTGDNGVFSVLVANVTIDSGSVKVENWRYAAGAIVGNPLPEVNPSVTGATAASWMFDEDSVFAINNRLYVLTGDWNGDGTRSTSDFGIFSSIGTDGSLGAWDFTAQFPAADGQAIGGAAHASNGGVDYLYYMGGTGSGLARVYVGAIDSGTGNISAWTATTDLPTADWFNRATASGSSVIAGAGNLATTRAVNYATVGAGGALGAWTAATDYPGSGKQWDYVMVTATSPGGTDYIVVAGGSALDGGVYTCPVTAGVPGGTWVTTNSLPSSVRRVSAATVGDVIIVTGGTVDTSAISAATSQLQVGRIDDSGAITWTTSDADANIDAMPQPRAFGGAAFIEATFPVETNAGNWSVYK